MTTYRLGRCSRAGISTLLPPEVCFVQKLITIASASRSSRSPTSPTVAEPEREVSRHLTLIR